jgi:endogenous inhibitor of DNA gyrase (YacG/DUF329 family)
MNPSGPTPPPPAPKGKCPICGKPAALDSRPFCSPRCKQVDLNRWLSETYRLPDRPAEDDEEDRPPTAVRPGAFPDPDGD